MKKILLLVILLSFIISCTDEEGINIYDKEEEEIKQEPTIQEIVKESGIIKEKEEIQEGIVNLPEEIQEEEEVKEILCKIDKKYDIGNFSIKITSSEIIKSLNQGKIIADRKKVFLAINVYLINNIPEETNAGIFDFTLLEKGNLTFIRNSTAEEQPEIQQLPPKTTLLPREIISGEIVFEIPYPFIKPILKVENSLLGGSYFLFDLKNSIREY